MSEQYAFCALLARMKYITRWGLMRSARQENLSEHSAEVAVIAHVLGLMAAGAGEEVSPERLAVAALYHDASEILTGDMPTPVKYKNEELRRAYKQVERESAEELAALLPGDLRGALAPYLTGDALNPAEKVLLKAADRISALVKCVEEEAAGNTEFRSARRQQEALLREMDCPAAQRFLAEFMPCYERDLDGLVSGV